MALPPGYTREVLAAIRKWLTDDTVCGADLLGPNPCLRISACDTPGCPLRESAPDPE